MHRRGRKSGRTLALSDVVPKARNPQGRNPWFGARRGARLLRRGGILWLTDQAILVVLGSTNNLICLSVYYTYELCCRRPAIRGSGIWENKRSLVQRASHARCQNEGLLRAAYVISLSWAVHTVRSDRPWRVRPAPAARGDIRPAAFAPRILAAWPSARGNMLSETPSAGRLGWLDAGLGGSRGVVLLVRLPGASLCTMGPLGQRAPYFDEMTQRGGCAGWRLTGRLQWLQRCQERTLCRSCCRREGGTRHGWGAWEET